MNLVNVGRDAWLLTGGLNWTDIVGSAAEWRAVADWLREPFNGGLMFRHITVSKHGDGFRFSSPRTLTPSDAVSLTRDDALQLADQIELKLREQREPLTLGA